MINIVKLLNGNVAIYDNTSGDFLFSLSPVIIEMHCDTNGNLRVVQNNDNFEFFDPSLVANTQVLPAAAIAFSGSCADLADILATDFFFELTETINAIDVNYDNSVSGLVSTNVQNAIDELATFSGGGGILHGTASGTDTYTVSLTGITSYSDGDAYLIRFTNGNTTTATLNVNSLGAKTLYRNNDGTVIGGDIWSGAEMLCVYNSTLNGFQCIGTTSNALFSYVTNSDSVTLTKGMPVYAFGGTGDRMTVKRANNSSDATSAQTVGLVLSTSIGVNQKGIIMMQGLLTNLSILPTSTFADGDTIYLGSTAGSITNIKPYAPNHLVYLGVVTTANNGSAGRMYVRVQNGYELDELHNVSAQSPADKDGIFFNTATQLWEKKSISTALGYTPVTNARTISTTSPLSGGGDLTADRTLSIQDAAADGTTKGAATFTASDFNSSSGLISIDYTNGQAASGSNKGFLTSTDWTAFNSKESALTFSAPLSRAVNTISIPVATSLVDGYLSSIDWTTFNNKQNALGFTAVPDSRTISTTSPLSGGGNLTANRTLSISQSNTTTDGYLSSTDWNTFNGKQNALGFTPVPNTRTLTINGSTQDLSADRTFTIADAAGWTYIVKSANQDVTNNATFQDDTQLQFSVIAGGHYMIEMDIVMSASSTTADYKFCFAISSGTMKGQANCICYTNTGTAQVILSLANATSTSTAIPVGTQLADIDMLASMKIIYSFTASANATLKYQFANNTATAGAISRTWKGSILKYKRID